MLYLFWNAIKQATGMYLFSFTTLTYMSIRSVIIYTFGVILARFNKKLLGIRTPFNFLLFIMFGSLAAGAIIDEQLFIPIFGTMFLLIVLNSSMTIISFYFPFVEHLVKGSPSVIVKNGQIQWRTMRNNFITKRELVNELHFQLHTHNLEVVKLATLESDGTINFIIK